MSSLDVRTCAGQVLVAGFPGTEAPGPLLDAVDRGQLGGVILFTRNLGSVHDVAGLIARLCVRAPAELPLLVGVDQEGGRVARLKAPVLTLPPMARLGALGDVDLTRRAGALLGRQLQALGFTMDYAPVLDVDSNPDNPVIGDRAFATEPAQAARLALAFADGLAEHVLTCGKHFPGHGDTNLDSHLALPRLKHDRQRLDRVELAPFRAARDRVDALMTAHVIFEALCPGVPATLARPVVTDLLRGELGFDGVIVSDDLEMKAIADHVGVERAACEAIAAGCDQLLICSRWDWVERAHAALVQRAEAEEDFAARLADAAERGLSMRRRRRPQPITEPSALERALAPHEARALEAELAAALGEHGT